MGGVGYPGTGAGKSPDTSARIPVMNTVPGPGARLLAKKKKVKKINSKGGPVLSGNAQKSGLSRSLGVPGPGSSGSFRGGM